MANPYHDETGKFCSKGEMQGAMFRLARNGDTEGYLKLRTEFEEINHKAEGHQRRPELPKDVEEAYNQHDTFFADPVKVKYLTERMHEYEEQEGIAGRFAFQYRNVLARYSADPAIHQHILDTVVESKHSGSDWYPGNSELQQLMINDNASIETKYAALTAAAAVDASNFEASYQLYKSETEGSYHTAELPERFKTFVTTSSLRKGSAPAADVTRFNTETIPMSDQQELRREIYSYEDNYKEGVKKLKKLHKSGESIQTRMLELDLNVGLHRAASAKLMGILDSTRKA